MVTNLLAILDERLERVEILQIFKFVEERNLLRISNSTSEYNLGDLNS